MPKSQYVDPGKAFESGFIRFADIQKLVFPHPTVCEVIREGMFL